MSLLEFFGEVKRLLWIRKNNFVYFLKAFFNALKYRFPSKKLKVIGITGTDGKTTTVSLLFHSLKELGKNPMVVSTVDVKIGDFSENTPFTTPHSDKVQFYLSKGIQEGCDYAILEVSAHALDQSRVGFVNFTIGGLTNITRDHILSKEKILDYFGTFKKYRDVKIRLLKKAKKSVVNKDDKSYLYIKKVLKKDFYTYSLKDKADFTLDFNKYGLGDIPSFFKEDYLLAYSVLRLLGFSEEAIVKSFKTFRKPSGRMEIIYNKERTVIIDFAHTENAFKRVLPYIKNTYAKKGRLIHVFGAPGLRDFSKRPKLGRYSSKYSDVIILTEEDFRKEDINVIFSEIQEGFVKDFTLLKSYKDYLKRKKYKEVFFKEPVRRKAIELAFKISKPGDTLLFTGKGPEGYLHRKTTSIPWDEKKEILKVVKGNEV